MSSKNGDGWDPKNALGPMRYLKFKAGRWTRVNSFPEWVTNNEPTYTEGRRLSIDSDRAYYEKEIWVGKSIKYMMKWSGQRQRELELDGMFVKTK